jgi:hypothetical protein
MNHLRQAMPPKWQPILSSTEPENPAASVEDPQDEDLDVEIEKLQRQIEEK